MNIADSIEGAQWFSGRVLDSRPKDRTGVTALWSLSKTHILSSLVLVQPRKTRPYTTERLLMERQKSTRIETR